MHVMHRRLQQLHGGIILTAYIAPSPCWHKQRNRTRLSFVFD